MDLCISHHLACRSSDWRRWLLIVGFGVTGALSMSPVQAQEMCGGLTYPFPYTDVASVGAPFCPGIMEAYVTGVSKGTSPTTFSPNNTVTRVQMTTFLQRSLDQGLKRTSRRAALNQWWTPQTANAMQTIGVGGIAGDPLYCAADGEFIWTSTLGDVVQVQASTGAVLGTWTGIPNSESLVIVAGKVYLVGQTSPGTLYVIDPTQPPGPVAPAANTLGDNPIGIAFDGTNIWTANYGGGSVSIINPQATTVTTVTTGFTNPFGVLYDGAHIWVTDIVAGTLLKLSSAGAILQTVPVGTNPWFPVFDGTNIWVPNNGDNSITVVQASTGNVVATISPDASNQLNGIRTASFDGERVLITNTLGDSVSVFKAADLSFIANVPTGTSTAPWGACSDGINFWVPLAGAHNLLRF
jgi:YVTN family beta-propeller protein